MAPRSLRKIAEGLRQFRLDQVFLEEHKAELLREHPNQWVGVFKGETLFAPSLAELVKKLGGDASRAAVAHLEPNPKALILAREQDDYGFGPVPNWIAQRKEPTRFVIGGRTGPRWNR